MLSKAATKIGKYTVKKLFGIQLEPQPDLDQNQELELTSTEALAGGEKEVVYKSERTTKKLIVKIPAGIKSGTQIRLKGMGLKKGKNSGDLFLKVVLKE
jgi:DnaJ-class molecular chaperone